MSDSHLSLSRRNMLAGVALAGVASKLVDPVNAQTPPASALQSPAFYRYTVGDLKLTAIHEGYNQVPIENFVKNASLDDVRKLAEEQFFPKDSVRVTFTTPASVIWVRPPRAAGWLISRRQVLILPK